MSIRECLLGLKSIIPSGSYLGDCYILEFYIKVNLSIDGVKMFQNQTVFSIWRHQGQYFLIPIPYWEAENPSGSSVTGIHHYFCKEKGCQVSHWDINHRRCCIFIICSYYICSDFRSREDSSNYRDYWLLEMEVFLYTYNKYIE